MAGLEGSNEVPAGRRTDGLPLTNVLALCCLDNVGLEGEVEAEPDGLLVYGEEEDEPDDEKLDEYEPCGDVANPGIA